MMLQNLNNSQPSFGMAMRKPRPEHLKAFSQYIDTADIIERRGLKSFIKKQENVKHDIRYVTDKFEILEPETEKVVKEISIKKTDINLEEDPGVFGYAKAAFKFIYYSIFKPEKLLPIGIKKAGRAAINADKKAEIELAEKIRKEKMQQKALERIDKIFSNSAK